MEILLCPMGSAGDVFPFLGIGKGMQSLGFEVTLCTADHFESHAKNLGFNFQRLGQPGAYEKSIHNPLIWHPMQSFRFLYEEMVLPTLEEQYDAVAKLAGSESIALVSCFGFGGLCAGEKTNALVSSVHLQPSVLASLSEPPLLPQVFGPKFLRRFLLKMGSRFVIDPTVLPTLNRFREEKGLPPIRDVLHWWRSKKLNLMLFPHWFARPAEDWPRPFVQTSFPLWESGQNLELPEDLSQYLNSGSPPIALTAGSANIHAAEFFQNATEACSRIGIRPLYLSADASQLPHPLPKTAFDCPFVSLQKLLPRCKAIVSHGGVGTISQAIAAGIPQVIVPLAHDQFDNAERISKLQLGVVIKKRSPSSSDLEKALLQLDTTGQIKIACAKYQQKLNVESGVGQAVESLQSFFQSTFEK